MFECEGRDTRCAVHRLPVEKCRKVYASIIYTNYAAKDRLDIKDRTDRIMLDDDQQRVLDDEPSDVMERAACAGRYYEAKVAEYLVLTFGVDHGTAAA